MNSRQWPSDGRAKLRKRSAMVGGGGPSALAVTIAVLASNLSAASQKYTPQS